MTARIDGDRDAVSIGCRVRVRFVDAEDGFVLPHFVVAEEGAKEG